MKISGKLIKTNDIQKISEKFQKRSFVIEYFENPKYPEYINFELIQDKCTLIELFREGEIITVNFNIKGRKWINPEGEIKYFNSLQCWRIEKNESINEDEKSKIIENKTNDDIPF